jgi:hypothetical protein
MKLTLLEIIGNAVQLLLLVVLPVVLAGYANIKH